MVRAVFWCFHCSGTNNEQTKSSRDFSQGYASDFEQAVSLLHEDKTIPSYVKTFFLDLVWRNWKHAKKEANHLQRNRELANENDALGAEIDDLILH